MKATDIVKPEPDTGLGVFVWWMNTVETKLRTLPGVGKRIEVKQYYNCPRCGAPTDFQWECEKCADQNGGDGQDD